MVRTNMSGSDLRDSVFVKANAVGLDISQANATRTAWIESNMSAMNAKKAVLKKCRLEGITARYGNWRETRLDRAQFQFARLERVQLQSSRLYAATLDDAKLDRCDLSGADLSSASPARTSLAKVTLEGAKLNKADLREALLEDTQLATARSTTPHCYRQKETRTPRQSETGNVKKRPLTCYNFRMAPILPPHHKPLASPLDGLKPSMTMPDLRPLMSVPGALIALSALDLCPVRFPEPDEDPPHEDHAPKPYIVREPGVSSTAAPQPFFGRIEGRPAPRAALHPSLMWMPQRNHLLLSSSTVGTVHEG